jgi:hypothetical protein
VAQCLKSSILLLPKENTIFAGNIQFPEKQRHRNRQLIAIVPSLFLSSQSSHKGSVIIPIQPAKNEKKGIKT